MDNKSTLLANLELFDLTHEESTLYVELLKQPNTHLQLSRITGINRSKVYRVIEQLEKRSMVARRSDDTGTLLVACDPSALEIDLVAQEEKLKQKRAAYEHVQTLLKAVQSNDTDEFVVYNYAGYEGLRQMQWREFAQPGEVLVLGNVLIEQLVGSRRWAEKYRARAATLNKNVREIINQPYNNPNFTDTAAYDELYDFRFVSESQLPVGTPIIITGDTVAIYQIKGDKRSGVEIISPAFADTMRHVFEQYWSVGTREPRL